MDAPKRIVLLAQPDGDIVAHYVELGWVAGKFHRMPSGEISFEYRGGGRRWYVNRSAAAFAEAAAVFNRCCELHADDEECDDEAAWSLIAAQLAREFESIEPLGDPEKALWSATVNDAEGGLFSLF